MNTSQKQRDIRGRRLKARNRSLSFRAGTEARQARGLAAERLKAQGLPDDRAFAVATSTVQRASPQARRSMAARRR